jgi:methionine sulfoxide reductase heme-binding subunit
MRSRTKWIFCFLLLLPMAWFVYATLTNQMGANPAERLNKKLGEFTLYLFLANLYWGSFEALIHNRILKPWFPLRRQLGVMTFFYACMHFSSYFLREGDFDVALKQLTQKVYLLFGLSALLTLLLLAATSNNWSVRRLKFQKWKKFHRLVYAAFFLITIHVLLIEKRSWLANKYTLFPMMAVLIFRFCHSVRHQLRHKLATQKKV